MITRILSSLILIFSISSWAGSDLLNQEIDSRNVCSEEQIQSEVNRRLEALLGQDSNILTPDKVLYAEGGGNNFEDMDQIKNMLRSITPKVTLIESLVSGCDKDSIKEIILENKKSQIGIKEMLAIAAALSAEERACIIEVFSELD